MEPGLLQINKALPGIDPEILFKIGAFPVTNTFVTTLLIMLGFVVLATFFIRRFRLQPARFQSAVEVLYEEILSLTNSITGSVKQSKAIFPLIATLIIYIGVANLLGLIPGLTSFTYQGTAIFRSPTTDFNTTFGLAFAMVLLLQVISVRNFGFFGYLGQFVKIKPLIQGFKKSLSEGFFALIEFGIGLLDIISEIAKVISLSVRLFGNMYAGKVLAVVLLGAVAYVVPALWLLMSGLFAVIQALVFGALVAAYYTFSIKPDEEEEAFEEAGESMMDDREQSNEELAIGEKQVV